MIETEDIYLAAFGLVSGGELIEVSVRGTNGRRMAFFRIEGAGMERIERDYHRGAALVDLRLLKSEVRRLKDRAFDALREERNESHERRDRRDQASERPGRSRHRAWD